MMVSQSRLDESTPGAGANAQALQPHQITIIADPSQPIRALLGLVDADGASAEAKARRSLLARKLSDPALGALINNRLAPGGLN